MMVSFVIVALNSESTINNILGDLKNQTYDKRNIEVVLVDSCSSDGTKELMKKFKDLNEVDFCSITVLDNPGITLPCGWNVALKECSGDIVLRVDAHTRIPENFVALNVKTQMDGHKICGGQVRSILEKDSYWQKCLYMVENSSFCGGASDFRKAGGDKYVDTLGFASYSMEVFEKVGGYDERLARTEDNEMHYRMRSNGYRFWFNSQIVSYRYLRSSLKKMIKQKFSNGKWVGLTLSVCPRCFSKLYFVPLAFVLAIIFCVIMVFTVSTMFILMLFSVYFLASAFAAVKCAVKEKFNLVFISIPFLFFVLHVSYGVGTLVGILKIPFWKRKNLGCDEIDIVRNAIIEKRTKSEY